MYPPGSAVYPPGSRSVSCSPGISRGSPWYPGAVCILLEYRSVPPLDHRSVSSWIHRSVLLESRSVSRCCMISVECYPPDIAVYPPGYSQVHRISNVPTGFAAVYPPWIAWSLDRTLSSGVAGSGLIRALENAANECRATVYTLSSPASLDRRGPKRQA
ncbi:Protein of unknown function [Gryllus bimaculatus]|nr:Protein of unknown function [Gryllus bimaculatus]